MKPKLMPCLPAGRERSARLRQTLNVFDFGEVPTKFEERSRKYKFVAEFDPTPSLLIALGGKQKGVALMVTPAQTIAQSVNWVWGLIRRHQPMMQWRTTIYVAYTP